VQSAHPKLRLLIADDHPDVLEEICKLLAVEFDVIGTVCDGARLVEAARTLSPDIVVTDLNMPGLNGIEAARRIIDLDLCTSVVVLTVHKDSELARTALDAGIRGYVLKQNAGEELIGAVRAAADGKIYVSAAVTG
jgi:DNA-binding NarL/FixJ family response regulator